MVINPAGVIDDHAHPLDRIVPISAMWRGEIGTL